MGVWAYGRVGAPAKKLRNTGERYPMPVDRTYE
jgi:hypothetical protein